MQPRSQPQFLEGARNFCEGKGAAAYVTMYILRWQPLKRCLLDFFGGGGKAQIWGAAPGLWGYVPQKSDRWMNRHVNWKATDRTAHTAFVCVDCVVRCKAILSPSSSFSQSVAHFRHSNAVHWETAGHDAIDCNMHFLLRRMNKGAPAINDVTLHHDDCFIVSIKWTHFHCTDDSWAR